MLNRAQAKEAKNRVLDVLKTMDFENKHFAVGVVLPNPEAGREGHQVAVRVADKDELKEAQAKIAAAGIDRANIDYRIVGAIQQTGATPVATPPAGKLAMGDSVSHVNGGPGTLGFFAETEDGVRGFVSCNHVIARADNFQTGDVVVSPASSDVAPPAPPAGKIKRVASLTVHKLKYADAAFAEVADDRWPDHPGFLGDHGMLKADLAQIRRGAQVFKIGRTTHRTAGRIFATWMDWFRIDLGDVKNIRLHGVIEIESLEKNSAPFCDEGDSGSPVYIHDENGENRPLGLLFSRSLEGGPNDIGFGYANPIGKVMRALDVKLVV